MTMTPPKVEQLHDSAEGSRFKPALLRTDDDRFGEWLDTRHDFMLKRGWMRAEGDWDQYDEYPLTEQIVLYDEFGKLTFGMRLTPVSDFHQSLSWEMVQGSPIHEQVERNEALLSGEGLWDLTRLVPGDGISRQVSAEAIPRLFGEGLRICQERGDSNPAWIFALDQPTKKWLNSEGVEIIELGEAVLQGDRRPTIFGVVRPAEIATTATASEFTKRSMVGKNDDGD